MATWHNLTPATGTEAATVIDSFFWRKLLVRSGLARFLPSVRQQLACGVELLRFYSDRVLASPLDQLVDNALMSDVSSPDSINLALGRRSRR